MRKNILFQNIKSVKKFVILKIVLFHVWDLNFSWNKLQIWTLFRDKNGMSYKIIAYTLHIILFALLY